MTAHGKAQPRGFWSTFWGMTIRPWRTLGELARDPAVLRNGVLLLLLITLVYTLILAIFIVRGYPAAAPSVLPLTVEQQYPVQIWYQGPLFLASTALTAGVLVLAGRLVGSSPAFRLAFARIAYASVIPFFFTTMLIELALALLFAVGVVQPDAVLNWLLGPGAWFPTSYQLISIAWIATLFVMAAWQTLAR
ncbi:MAG: hypothetical protein PVH59_13160, partial [Anaerolineae bacterium]